MPLYYTNNNDQKAIKGTNHREKEQIYEKTMPFPTIYNKNIELKKENRLNTHLIAQKNKQYQQRIKIE